MKQRKKTTRYAPEPLLLIAKTQALHCQVFAIPSCCLATVISTIQGNAPTAALMLALAAPAVVAFNGVAGDADNVPHKTLAGMHAADLDDVLSNRRIGNALQQGAVVPNWTQAHVACVLQVCLRR